MAGDSMGHQAHRMPDGRSSKQSRRPKPLPEGHFDPDELCRRLYVVLADQKAHAERSERKRRARAEAAIPSSSANLNSRNTNNPNINNNSNVAISSTSRRGDHTQQRSQDGRRPDSYPTTSQPSKTVATSTDLITELRRTRSSAKHNSCRHGAAETGINNTTSLEQKENEYHHVPREAAKQFARTTTVEVMRNKERESLVHQLSKRALRFHKQGGRAPADPLTTAPSELNRALRHSQSQRDKILDRNQFQRTRILEEAAQLDHERVRESNRPHTFEHEIARILPEQNKNRRNSTGNTELFDRVPGGIGEHNRKSVILMDPLLDVDEDSTSNDEYPQGRAIPHEHRVDWSQSDESKRQPKLLLSPLLKKADSLWGLRGRLGSKASMSSSSGGGVGGAGTLKGIEENESGGSQEQIATASAVSAPSALPTATTPKSPKGGFFAKFRR